MIGYEVNMLDNDSYAFRQYPALTESQRIHQFLVADMSGTPRPGHRRCSKCGDLLAKWDEPLAGLVLTKRKYDISCTHDGVVAVSHKFRQVYDSHQLTGLTFTPLPDDPTFSSIMPTEAVRYEADERENQCPVCGHYESVVVPIPVFIREGKVLPDRGFVRSDLEFASEDEKSPVILCGQEAGDILKKSKLRGLDLVPLEKIVTQFKEHGLDLTPPDKQNDNRLL